MKPLNYANVDEAIVDIRPLGDFVLVERLREQEQQNVLIRLPGDVVNPDRPGIRKGVVLAVGPGDRLPDGTRAPMHVAVGDTVLYSRAPANGLLVNGREVVFLREEQHLEAVLEEALCPNAN